MAGPAPSPPGHLRGGWGRWLILAALLGLAAVAGLSMLGDPAGDTDEPPLAGGPEESSPDEQGAGTDDGGGQPTERAPDAADDTGQDGGEAAATPTEGDSGTPDATADTDAEEPDISGDGPFVVPETATPDGWQTVSGETYEVSVPDGWQRREVEGNRTDWVDPSTGAYLRVDWTDAPAADPVADWEQAEAGFRDRFQDYARVRLEPARYREWDAAMWEYTYASGASSLHAINLNVLADDLDHAFALNLQAPGGEWDRIGAHFPAIAGSFRPTVGGG